METTTRLFWIAAVLALVVAALLLFVPWLRQELAPEPRRAWVAIEVDGTGVARPGPVELPAGSPFRLHAVLEARSRSGTPVYYTEAPALEIEGRAVPQRAIRPWEGPLAATVLWFTVEPVPPVVDVAREASVEAFHYQDLLRAEWPRAWSIPGRVDPATPALATGADEFGPFGFGTAYFRVRIDLYGVESAIRPQRSFASTGAEGMPAAASQGPRATLQLPGRLAPASRVFGTAQLLLEPGEDVPEPLADDLAAGQLFVRHRVLSQVVLGAGRRLGELSWSRIDLEEGGAWGPTGGDAGDLIRVADRVVVLYQDRAPAGRLGREDLCFDFDSGPAVRSLGEIFVGDGLVELADLDTVAGPEATNELNDGEADGS